MSAHQDDLDQWLSRERDADDAAAEQAFGSLFQSLPRAEAGAAVIDRLVAVVWRAERRRRRLQWAARTAAVVVVTSLAAAIAYGLFAYAVPSLAALSVAVASVGTRSIADLARAAVDWWAWTGRFGEGAQVLLARPETLALLWGLETTGLLALWGLHRLVRAPRGSVLPVGRRT
jgi:hypothetical protein